MRSHGLTAGFIGSIAILSATACQAGPVVNGWAVTSPGNLPVGGASVALYQGSAEIPVATALSQPNGSFSLEAPQVGSYRILIGAMALQPIHYSIEVPVGGYGGLVAALPANPKVQIQVVDSTGHNAPQTQVWLGIRIAGRDAANPSFMMPTGAARELRLQNSPWTDYRWISSVEIVARSSGVGIGRVRVPGWPVGKVVIRLDSGAHLSGKVLNATGHAMPGTQLCLAASPAGSQFPFPDRFYGSTTPTGRFDLVALPAGSYTLSVDSDKAGKSSQSVDLHAGMNQCLMQCTEPAAPPPFATSVAQPVGPELPPWKRPE